MKQMVVTFYGSDSESLNKYLNQGWFVKTIYSEASRQSNQNYDFLTVAVLEKTITTYSSR